VKFSCCPLPALLHRIPLRLVLVVPFVCQIVVAVGVTGWLSLRNSQEAISNLANQLNQQASNHVGQNLTNYLDIHYQINEVNRQAMQLGMLTPQKPDAMRQFFWKQMQLSKNLSYVNWGDQTGTFIGIGREDDGSLYTEQMKPSDRFYYKRYSLNQQGDPTKLLARKHYLFQQDAWYKSAVRAGKPLWSPIYQWEDRPEIISISSSYPVYNSANRIVGVLGVDFTLSQLSDRLRTLDMGETGKIFIIERNGMIVASSSQEKPYVEVHGSAQRLNAAMSQEPLIRDAAQQLNNHFGSLAQIHHSETLSMTIAQQQTFVSVMPWNDRLGLDWLIVVVVPKSDFMTQIHINTRNTLLLCSLALAIAILVGLMTSRWLTQSIRQLAEASQAIAKGRLHQPVQVNGIDEFMLLSESFNEMALRLQSSFAELETRVAQRTLELAQAKNAAETANQAKSEFLAQVSHELRTPLNAIIGFAQMMASDLELSEKHQSQVAIMHRNGIQLLALINDILKVSRLQTSEYQIHSLEHTLTQRSQQIEQCTLSMPQTLQSYLGQMSPEWAANLHQAAVKGSDDDILHLIDEIPDDLYPLANILKSWTGDYYFDHIIHLVQQRTDD